MAKQRNNSKQGLKKQYDHWLKEYLKNTGVLPAEGTIKKALTSVGIKWSQCQGQLIKKPCNLN